MFNLFKKKDIGTKLTLKLSGLHCAACSLNIDDALEDTKGVIASQTNYARQESVVTYDPAQVETAQIKAVIEQLGYQVIA